MPDYPKEQLLELYKNLPKDLQEALYSEQSAKNVQEICTKTGVTNEDTIFDINKNIGYVLLGLLSPNEFQKVLEKELNLERNKAEQIARQITRFVLSPVKKSLEALYKIEIKSGREPLEVAPPPEKKPKKREDTYREPLK